MQRQKLAMRVESAGGWDAIKRDCLSLAKQHTEGFHSTWRDTNLPPAIIALKPLLVQYDPAFRCINMRIFGIHSTGGHSTPFLGLEVVTEQSPAYKPGAGYHHSAFREVAEGIYELY